MLVCLQRPNRRWVAPSLTPDTAADGQAQFFNTHLFGTDFSGLYQAARDEVFGKLM